jgi:hypothetical protein
MEVKIKCHKNKNVKAGNRFSSLLFPLILFYVAGSGSKPRVVLPCTRGFVCVFIEDLLDICCLVSTVFTLFNIFIMTHKKKSAMQELPLLQGVDKSFHDALGIPEGDTEVNQELLSAAQQTFEQIINVNMLGDKKDWEFDQYEMRRILGLLSTGGQYPHTRETKELKDLIDVFLTISSSWETIEQWEKWTMIRNEIVNRLCTQGLFEKLGIHLQCVVPSLNGKPAVQ